MASGLLVVVGDDAEEVLEVSIGQRDRGGRRRDVREAGAIEDRAGDLGDGDDETGPTTPTTAGSAARRLASAAAREVWSYTLLGSIVNDEPCLALNASSATRAQFICAGWVDAG